VVFNRKPQREDTATLLGIDRLCREYGVLPRSGGLLEQDQLTIRKLHLVIKARDDRAAKEDAEAKAEAKRARRKR
jgi:hypothetical protein